MAPDMVEARPGSQTSHFTHSFSYRSVTIRTSLELKDEIRLNVGNA